MQHPEHPEGSANTSILKHFSVIADWRTDRGREHLLVDILVISVLAMLCGAEHFTEFEVFGKARLDWLRTFLRLPNGIPSHDTFRRVFMLLDPALFSECFRDWTQSLREAIGQEIDSLRSPFGLPCGSLSRCARLWPSTERPPAAPMRAERAGRPSMS